MTIAQLSRRASAALLALSIAACGDSNGPSAQLTEAQVQDMLDAMSSVAYDPTTAAANLAVVTVSDVAPCPDGGNYSVNGTINENEAAGTATVQIAQGFSGCKATSSQDRLWTFDGGITTNLSLTSNQATGAFSINGTQSGTVQFASDLGTGSCTINLTMAISSDGDSFDATISGTACGHTINVSASQ